MIFTPPLIKGTLLKRYKRFFADVLLEAPQKIVTAHCPNTGSMLGLTQSGQTVWLSKAENPSRKLPYTWEIAEQEGCFIGVNTNNPNRLIKEALEARSIPELMGYDHVKAEVPFGERSRIDFVLFAADGLPVCYLEVKNVHFKVGKQARFPDSVTVRGAKHMRELETLAQKGYRCVIFYLIQRDDCTSFDLASDLDPLYTRAALQAFQQGVEPLVYACRLSPQLIQLQSPLDFTRRQSRAP